MDWNCITISPCTPNCRVGKFFLKCTKCAKETKTPVTDTTYSISPNKQNYRNGNISEMNIMRKWNRVPTPLYQNCLIRQANIHQIVEMTTFPKVQNAQRKPKPLLQRDSLCQRSRTETADSIIRLHGTIHYSIQVVSGSTKEFETIPNFLVVKLSNTINDNPLELGNCRLFKKIFSSILSVVMYTNKAMKRYG